MRRGWSTKVRRMVVMIMLIMISIVKAWLERFTLDPDISMGVTEAFVRLHEAGLVYKGERGGMRSGAQFRVAQLILVSNSSMLQYDCPRHSQVISVPACKAVLLLCVRRRLFGELEPEPADRGVGPRGRVPGRGGWVRRRRMLSFATTNNAHFYVCRDMTRVALTRARETEILRDATP
jgi:hypothetical protein